MISCTVELKQGAASARTLPVIGRLEAGGTWSGDLPPALFDSLRGRRDISVVASPQDTAAAAEQAKPDASPVTCRVVFPAGNGAGRIVPGIGTLSAGEEWEGSLPRHLFDEYKGPGHDLECEEIPKKAAKKAAKKEA